ncbi:MAG: hypothetical protein ACFCUL_15415, partial [Flavobacteriaceae bacterium]
MKRIVFLLLFAIGISNALHAQVKIGNNPQNIDQASVLELESTDKVLVITRVTTAQMNAIVPLQGALVYNTDVQGVHYFDGAQWVNIGSGGGGPGGPLTANPIVNDVSTIVITPTGAGNNLEVAPNSITTDQIQDGGINGVDIQDGSIGPGKIQDFSVTQTKLSQNSVGAFALDNDNIGLQDFSNAVTQFITSADIVSGDAGNVLESRPDGAFYDDTFLMNEIQNNTDLINNHIAADLDISPGNEIQNLQLVGNQLTISGANTVTLPAGAAADGSETIINNSATITVTGTGTTASPYILTAIGGGGGGTTEVVDGTTLTGLGTPVDPFKIEPGANGQFLTTGPTGVAWTTVTPGGAGTTEVADQITITGDGQIATPFTVAIGGIGSTQLATDAVTTMKILDANVTNTKIAPGAADQILRTASDGLTVNWVDLPTGSASITDATLTGDGTSPATALGLADDAVTTAKILDANVTNTKIAPGAANQILRTSTDGLNVDWVDLPTGSGVLTDVTLTGDGSSVGTALSLANNAVTTSKILDANVTNAKIAPGAANQILRTSTDGLNVDWVDLPTGSGTIVDATLTGDGTSPATALGL